MFRSLMFKSNPLTEQFQHYRRRNAQTLQVKPFSIKSNLKNNKPSNLYKNQNLSKVRTLNPTNLRYEQFRNTNQNISFVMQKSPIMNEDKKDKCKFKIHNTIIKNDNYLHKDQIMPANDQKQRNYINGLRIKNSILNPETQKYDKMNDPTIYSRNHSRNTKKRSKDCQPNLRDSIDAKESTKNKLKNIDSELKNQLKYTLYQSIDLGNLFEKIESNIDQSQKLNSSQIYMNSEPFSPRNTNTVTKNTKIRRIELNKSQLKNSNPQKKINNFNLQNLFQKNGTSKGSTIASNIMDKSFFQSLTSRTHYTEKQKDREHQIPQIDEKNHQNWMPTRRKRSMAIVMDENGVIKEQTSGIGENEANSLRMSMKISNLRQMMKGEKLEFN